MLFRFFSQGIRKKFILDSKKSLSFAATNFLDSIKIVPKVHGNIETLGPIIYIVNHINPLDVLLLLSQTKEKTAFVTLAVNDLGREFNQNRLPIFISTKDTKHPLLKFLALYWARKTKIKSPDEIRSLNQQTLVKAAKILNQNGRVIFFPQGLGFMPGRPWKPGIGYLLKQTKKPDIQIQYIKLSGLLWPDLIRPVLPFLPYPKQTVRIKLLPPKKIDLKTIEKLTGKELTQFIETDYKKSFKIE
jgi:1-acyl-sn-glycerol-3-phosphate acyltransferase